MWDGSGKMSLAVVQMACLYRGMLAVRAGLRPLIPGLRPLTFRAFSVRRAEPDSGLEENPYYSKYHDKIQRLRSAKPQEYQVRLQRRQEVQMETLGTSQQAQFITLMEQELEKRDKMAARGAAARGFTKDKTLGSILNLDLMRDKTGEEIGEIWMKYYSTKDTISAVIPAQTFSVMFNRAASCPMFLYALPQAEGYEFLLGQWAGHQLHFTSLINVQTSGEHAPSQLILCHHPELQEEKGVVLMSAERDPTFITVHQAQCLANQVQLFYGTQRQETFRLVEMFNHRPADFSHMAVIAELEQSGLGPALQTQPQT